MIYDVLGYGTPSQQHASRASAASQPHIIGASPTFPKHLFKLCSPDYFNIDCSQDFCWDDYPWSAGLGVMPVFDTAGYVLVTRMLGSPGTRGLEQITAYYAAIRAKNFSPLTLLSLFSLLNPQSLVNTEKFTSFAATPVNFSLSTDWLEQITPQLERLMSARSLHVVDRAIRLEDALQDIVLLLCCLPKMLRWRIPFGVGLIQQSGHFAIGQGLDSLITQQRETDLSAGRRYVQFLQKKGVGRIRNAAELEHYIDNIIVPPSSWNLRDKWKPVVRITLQRITEEENLLQLRQWLREPTGQPPSMAAFQHYREQVLRILLTHSHGPGLALLADTLSWEEAWQNIKSFSDNPIFLFLQGKDQYAQVIRCYDFPEDLQPNIRNRLHQIKDQIRSRVTDDQLLLRLLSEDEKDAAWFKEWQQEVIPQIFWYYFSHRSRMDRIPMVVRQRSPQAQLLAKLVHGDSVTLSEVQDSLLSLLSVGQWQTLLPKMLATVWDKNPGIALEVYDYCGLPIDKVLPAKRHNIDFLRLFAQQIEDRKFPLLQNQDLILFFLLHFDVLPQDWQDRWRDRLALQIGQPQAQLLVNSSLIGEEPEEQLVLASRKIVAQRITEKLVVERLLGLAQNAEEGAVDWLRKVVLKAFRGEEIEQPLLRWLRILYEKKIESASATLGLDDAQELIQLACYLQLSLDLSLLLVFLQNAEEQRMFLSILPKEIELVPSVKVMAKVLEKNSPEYRQAWVDALRVRGWEKQSIWRLLSEQKHEELAPEELTVLSKISARHTARMAGLGVTLRAQLLSRIKATDIQAENLSLDQVRLIAKQATEQNIVVLSKELIYWVLLQYPAEQLKKSLLTAPEEEKNKGFSLLGIFNKSDKPTAHSDPAGLVCDLWPELSPEKRWKRLRTMRARLRKSE